MAVVSLPRVMSRQASPSPPATNRFSCVTGQSNPGGTPEQAQREPVSYPDPRRGGMDSVLGMGSCLAHCLVDYVEKDWRNLLLTSAVMVLTLCVCFTRYKQAKEEAKTRPDEATGGNKEPGGDTLTFTPTEEAIEMLSLEMARQCFGRPASLYRRPPFWFLPYSRIQPPGGHRTEEETFGGQEPKSGGGGRAPRPESYYKKRPSRMRFKRTVRPSGRERSLSLSSILAVGIAKVMGLRPPVCTPKSKRSLLEEAEKFRREQHWKSHLTADRVGVPSTDCVQEAAMRVSRTKTELREPRTGSPSRAGPPEPRTSPEPPKIRPVPKPHPQSDHSGKRPETKAKSGQNQGGDGVKAAGGAAKSTESEGQISSFVRGLQQRIQQALRL